MSERTYRLFDDFATRYDLHTPSQHYRNDHRFVLEAFGELTVGRRILDVGCGTGVLLEKALGVGLDAHGIDISAGMIEQAARKVGADRVRVATMEGIDAAAAYSGICALSWVINYAADAEASSEILRRLHHALVPGGLLMLQTAHAPNMRGHVQEDRESGPSGEKDDVIFLFQFLADGADRAYARYVYAGKSLGELVWEEHPLAVANAELLANQALAAGFRDVRIFGSWRRDGLGQSISPWVVGMRATE